MGFRTYGLSGSGIDVDQMVKQLMDAKRVSYNTIYKKKTQLEWKKADYNTLYNALTDFRNTVFDSKLSSNLMLKKVSSSNTAAVTASANADAGNISHSVSVTNLADGVQLASSDKITTGTSKTTLAEQFGLGSSAMFTITLTNGSNSKQITVDPTKSIYELVGSINSAGVDMRASYDATLDRFFLTTTNTGAASGIDFAGSSPAGLTFLSTNLKLNTTAQTGQDAVLNLDGADITEASNTFTVSGVTYTLNNTTGGTAANIVVNPDIDQIVTNVKTFVDKYNEVLAKANSELNEVYYKDYLPLTDDEMAELKDTQVKAWDEKAHSGLLRRDPILRSLVDSMRNSFTDSIAGLTGKYRNASALGINTGLGKYTEGGKLYVNETKLRDALNEDPDIAYKIFGTNGDTAAADGVMTRLYDNLNAAVDKIKDEAGVTASATYDTTSNIGKRIDDYNDMLDAMSKRLKAAEDRYYKQFDAMETALSRMNQQSSWLMQQFSSGQ